MIDQVKWTMRYGNLYTYDAVRLDTSKFDQIPQRGCLHLTREIV